MICFMMEAFNLLKLASESSASMGYISSKDMTLVFVGGVLSRRAVAPVPVLALLPLPIMPAYPARGDSDINRLIDSSLSYSSVQ